jgi:hypothetical protein
MPWQDTGTNDVIPEVGITSTPVIDPATGTLYVEVKTKETVGAGCSPGSPCYIQRLHALDFLTGADKLTPAVISAPNFSSFNHMQRPALRLSNGIVYVAIGSHGDRPPWQGWLFAYDATTLVKKFGIPVTDPTTGNNGGGIWQAGAGPVIDASGNVYIVTGNGTFDPPNGNYGDAVVKLSPTGTLLDYFAPHEQATLQANDIDLGSSAAMVLPDAVGSAAHPHLLLATGKIGKLYLLDQSNLGQFHTSDQVVQAVVVAYNTTNLDGGIFGQPAYWNGNIYVVEVSDFLRQYSIANATLTYTSLASGTYSLRGATPAVSANGTSGGVVWVLDLSAWQTNGPAVLKAYDATNLGNLLYSSPVSGAGAAGAAVKFTVPTVANGKVYVGTQGQLSVFGWLPN